jgi:predicted GIY-YIG superfamily endonuclease
MALPTWLYVLRLEGGFFYVGTTSDLSGRFAAHWGGTGTAWTALHRPNASTVKRCTSAVEEDATVKQLMLKHGIARVRGGSYSAPRLDESSLRALELEMRHAKGSCFVCGDDGHWSADCPKRAGPTAAAGAEPKPQPRPKPQPQPRPRAQRPFCTRCGRDTHNADRCYARTHFDGSPITATHSASSDSSDEGGDERGGPRAAVAECSQQ